MAEHRSNLARRLARVEEKSKNYVDNGYHSFRVDDITLEEKESKFHDEKVDFVIFHLKNEEGVKLQKQDRFTYSKRGHLFKDLLGLGCLPEVGEDLDVDVIIGMEVEILVENVEKDGVTYSNVIEMKVASRKPKKIAKKTGGIATRRKKKTISKAEIEAMSKEQDDDYEIASETEDESYEDEGFEFDFD